MSARERFAELAERADADIPLAEAALWIAAESRPEVRVEERLVELARLGERAGRAVARAGCDEERVARLNHALFSAEGFAGNRADYHDPSNSFLDQVLERRTGIPITLSLVYVEVARALGLEASGIGFPGHFLAKVAIDAGDIVVDSFSGKILGVDDCRQLLRRAVGDRLELGPELLASASHRSILQRILGNLKLVYLGRREYEAALACIERILLLDPNDALEQRDRGLVYGQLECFGPAAADLDRFLERMPGHATAPAIRKLSEEHRRRSRQIH